MLYLEGCDQDRLKHFKGRMVPGNDIALGINTRDSS